uniref:Mediator of RNA polymerase II transcription subunit 1 n=1 Tax=Mola mola TaxID=94237 RepID=A0A3Q4ANB0_MOLML
FYFSSSRSSLCCLPFSLVSELRVKFADRTWNETFQLVRRCMVRQLFSAFCLCSMSLMSSLNTTKSRLEVIAKQQGMSFHMTDATCYLTADLFHLEVLLLPCGGVEDVKVAPHAGFPVLRMLIVLLIRHRSKHFAEFSVKLAGLCAQYNIPGDKYPLLQDGPVFLPLSEVSHEMLPAFFLLKLQPAIPITLSLVNKLSQITDVVIPEVDLQWAPLPKLLMRQSQHANSHQEAKDEQDPLPGGVTHNYILPGAAWEVPAQTGTVVDSIPFTHPAHIPALLELLRHQCTVNTLLRTCMASQYARTGRTVFPPHNWFTCSKLDRRKGGNKLWVLVDISDSHQISCTLFGAGIKDSSLDEYLSTVMKRYGFANDCISTTSAKVQRRMGLGLPAYEGLRRLFSS